MLGDQNMWCREENFIVFYVRAAIDRDTMEWTTKFPSSKPWTRLLLYLSLAGFVCCFSLRNPSMAYAGQDEENSVCVTIKVLVDNVCACEKRDLVKSRFWKSAWIFLRREVNYLKKQVR